MSQLPYTATGVLGSCSWPLHPISQHRELDLTQCFEHAVLLPAPLVLTILFALLQIISKQTRLLHNDLTWSKRLNEGVCRLKIVRYPCGTR